MNKIERRKRRKKGIRKKIHGTETKPRISVFKSNRHIYAQAIDDEKSVTICSVSDFEEGTKMNVEGAVVIGEHIAEKLKKKKIKEAVFDRNGYLYHGVVKSVCEGIKKGGLKI
jgi:large subunit ribosomal protein L18